MGDYSDRGSKYNYDSLTNEDEYDVIDSKEAMYLEKFPNFTKEIRQVILDAIAMGLSKYGACEYAMVPVKEFKKWEKIAMDSTDPNDPMKKFIMETRRNDRVYQLELIRDSDTPNNPRIAFETLKSRYDEYNPKVRQEVTVEADVNTNIAEKKDRLTRMFENEDE